MRWLTDFLFDRKYRLIHAVTIITAVLVHGLMHYLTYIPDVREVIGNLPYFRLHILHEAEFLLIIVYAALTLRWKAGAAVTIFTALTSIPFILAPFIFGRDPRVDELRDNSIQVAFIIGMAALMILFIETAQRDRERVTAHARRLTSLAAVSRASAGSPETKEAVGHAVAVVQQTLPESAVLAYVFSPHSPDTLVSAGYAGVSESQAEKVRSLRLDAAGARLLRSEQSGTPAELPLPLVPLREVLPSAAKRIVSMPMNAQDEFVGLMTIALPQAKPPKTDLDFLRSAAGQLALVVRNTQLYEDEQRAHRQVVQQERLTALGQMASGIAHDINNALAPVLGFSDLMMSHPGELQDQEMTARYLKSINTNAKDIAQMVKRLRGFYVHGETDDDFDAVEMASLIEKAITTTEPRWKGQALAAGIEITVARHIEKTPPVNGDPSELREILVNFILNAADAMEKSGTITLSLRPEGSWAVLEVSDTGKGMSKETQEHCFEPFYSTKDGRGRGLGLAVTYGIIKRHRGKIEVSSAPGHGATFTIRLPAYETKTQEAPAAASGPEMGKLSILVADDEEDIRHMLAKFMSLDGHTVVTAKDRQEALEAFKKASFDILVTDRAMPKMNGSDLAAQVKNLSPHTPVILLTGFGDIIKAEGGQVKNIDAVVSKPVTIATLRESLEKAMLGKRQAAVR